MDTCDTRESRPVFLAADESPDNLVVVEELLAGSFPRSMFVGADSGEECLARARDSNPDVVLVDHQMPGIDGIKACEDLRRDSATKDVGIILVTAIESSPALRARCLDAGADDFVTKPFDAVELKARINVLLRLKRSEKKLRSLKERYRRLAESSPGGIVFWDTEGRLLEANDAFCRMIGCTQEDIGGMSILDVCPETLSCMSVAQLSARLCGNDAVGAEGEILRSDGTRVPVRTAAWMLHDDAGRRSGYGAHIEDRTAARLAEEERQKLRKQLFQAQKMESIGTLAGGAAHDFNNLLSVILGYAEFELEETEFAEGPHGASMQEIRTAALKARDVTKQILALSRKAKASFAPADAGDVGDVGEDTESTDLPPGDEHILIIDDEEMIAGLGEKMLSTLGYSVVSAKDCAEAVNLFSEDPNGFDLVVTNTTTPDMCGIEPARRLLEIRPGIPVVLCTEDASTVSPETAYEAGVKAFLHKPLGLKDLAETIRTVLDGDAPPPPQ